MVPLLAIMGTEVGKVRESRFACLAFRGVVLRVTPSRRSDDLPENFHLRALTIPFSPVFMLASSARLSCDASRGNDDAGLGGTIRAVPRSPSAACRSAAPGQGPPDAQG